MGVQKPARKKISKHFILLGSAMLITVLVLSLFYLPEKLDFSGISGILRTIENTSLNWRYSSKALTSGTVVLSQGTTRKNEGVGIYKKIYIAAIDEVSINHFGTYPLDNQVWADFLDTFNSNTTKPDAVIFDLFFNEPSSRPQSDRAFIESIARYEGTAGVDMMFYPLPEIEKAQTTGNWDEISLSRLVKKGQNYYSPEIQALKKFELPVSKPGSIPLFGKVNPAMIPIATNLGFMGTMNLADENGVFRKLPLITGITFYIKNSNTIRVTNIYYPSVVLSVAARVLQADLNKIRLENGAVVLPGATYEGSKMDFRIPVDDQMRLDVNYRAMPNKGYFQVLPVKKLVGQKFGLRRNAIVMVGIYVQGAANNIWQSPLGPMFSIEHIGYALGTILNRDFIHNTPVWLNIIYTLLLAAFVAWMVSRGIRSTIIGALLSIIIPFGLGFGLFFLNIKIVTLIPLIAGILTLIAGEVYILLTEEKEKRFIKNTFSKYVNPDLVNILIQNPDMLQLGGEDKDATMLFSDIRSFTTLSEGMTPHELIDFLNIYLTRMTDIVMETRGTLDKYIGDAVVAFWGTPIQLENHAFNACQAAVKMMTALEKFNQEQEAAGHKPIRIGIGLNSGNMTVGNIGSDKKKNYTAIGDVTVLAEELQDANKIYGTSICISEYTYSRVKDKVVVRELDSMYVKGAEKPIRIYELIDIVEGA